MTRMAVPAMGRVKQAADKATVDHCAAGDAKMRRARVQQARRKAKIDARWVASSTYSSGARVRRTTAESRWGKAERRVLARTKAASGWKSEGSTSLRMPET